jgi:hypothetical protein
MLGIRVCDGGMMKLNRGLASDNVWRSYVLCGVHIGNFEKWGCGILLWFHINIVHLMPWVIFKNSVKGGRVCVWQTSGRPLEDYIICPCASSQESVPLLYVVRIVGFICILGFRNLSCLAKHCPLRLMREKSEWSDPLDSEIYYCRNRGSCCFGLV